MKTILTIILSCFCITAVNAGEERIWVDGKINGKPVRLILDTGTTGFLALFSTTAKRLGIKYTLLDKKLDPGSVIVGRTERCKFSLGLNTAKISIAVMEVPPYIKLAEDGIIGWPAFKDNVISIDAITDKLSLGAHVPKDVDKWEKFQLETNLGLLALEIPFEKNVTGVVVLDTGSVSGVTLNSKRWGEWKSSHKNQPSTFEAYYTPNIGMVMAEESWAEKFLLGSLILTDVPVMEADSNDAKLGSSPGASYEASLGLAALKRLDIIIDGKNGFAFVRPKTTPPLPYKHNRLGAEFMPQNSHSDELVGHVANNSPAYKAGIRDGDILLKIDGQDVANWRTDTNPPSDVNAIQQPAGTKLELTLKRGDKIFTTTAVLRNILPPDAPENSD